MDYVLSLRGHRVPSWSRLRVIPARGPEGRDLSDHFPVEGTFVFPP